MSPRKLDDRGVTNEGTKLQRVREGLAGARRFTVAPPRPTTNAFARPKDVAGGSTSSKPR